MIRPRGGDFTYSDEEFEQMKEELMRLKSLKVDGFVFEF
jgi:copper homeostasis protein